MNRRLVVFSVMLSLCTAVVAVDLSTQREIARTDSFVFYAEDNASYSDLIDFVETRNAEFEHVFSCHIPETIRVYIFASQLSFSRHVFNSETPVQNTTALADHVSMAMYITSPYDGCKSYDDMLRTPVHELVHIYFPSGYVWIREGIAHYYSGLLTHDRIGELPRDLSEMRFYVDGTRETERAYHASAYLVKYIIEELCDGQISRFRAYAANPTDFTLIGLTDEHELFLLWHTWMRANYGSDA